MSKPNNIWKNERNFDDESLKKQRYFFVAEHNDLISKARHDLTARELKIMDYVISKIKPDDEHFNLIVTSMYELSNVLDLKRNGRKYSQIANNLSSMRRKDVYIYNEEERSITMTGWFERAKVWENGKIELKVNEEFAPYLLKLKDKGNYTQHLLIDTVKLKSKYSILLYKLMRETQEKDNQTNGPVLVGSLKDFKEALGAPEKYNYGRLKDKILKPTIEEINLMIDDMDLHLYEKKQGRKVVLAKIRNEWSTTSDTQIPIHDWLDVSK